MMNGFSDAETRAVLSANGLSDAEIEQALAFAQSGESIKLYNAEVIKAGLQNSVLSSTEQKLVLDKLGLIDATTGELISTKQVSQAKLEEALINAGLEASEASVTAERIVSTVAQGTQKASIEAILALTKKQIVENAKYIASMVAAHPVATALGVALAALGGAIVYNTHKEKEYQQALKDSVDTMSSATSEYSNSASKLDELVEKYKSLEKQLSLTNLTEEETYQIKSDLYDVQCDLIDNFGNEAKGIDLVNGEYREQLGLLQQINKEAAESYLTKNKEDYDNNINYLTDKEDFRSKYTSDWSSKNSGYMSDDLKNILEANGLTIDAEHWRSELGGAFTKYYVEFEDVTREEAYNLAMKLGEVLREAGENNADLIQDPYYDLVQSYLSYVTTELIDESELNSAKENTDYYEKLSAMYSSSFGDLYNSFIDARDNYLEALQTGENVDTAKINFDNIYGEFQNSSKVKSDEVRNAFDDIKNSIDEELVKLNDWEQSLSGSNELNVISALKLTDDQLRGINWDDEFTSPAEEAFGSLLTYLGASREDIEQVISLLVKMGVVMGEVNVKGNTSNIETPVSFDQAWADSFTSEKDAVKELGNTLLDLAEKGRLTVETFNEADSTNYFKNLGISADEAVSKINKLVDESKQLSSMSDQISKMSEALGTKKENGFVEADTLSGFDVEVRGLDSWDRFQEVLGSTTSSYNECQQAANALATEWVNSSDFLAQLTEQNEEYYETQLDAMGIANAYEVVQENLMLKTEELSLSQQYLAETGQELANVSEIERAEFIANAVAVGKCSQQYALFQLQKMLCNENYLDSTADIEGLLILAEAAGIAGNAISQLSSLKIGYDNAVKNGDTRAAIEINNQMLMLKSQIANEVANIGTDIKLDFSKLVDKKSSSSVSKSFAELLDKELNVLDKKMDAGYIDFNDYIRARLGLIEDYYHKGKLAADEYYSYLEKHYKQELSYRDKVVNAVTRRIDNEIDGLEKQKDEIEENYKLQIESLENEKSLLEDVNKERQKQINLQKSLYELERARNQRTKLIYSEDKGMHYVTDGKLIRDAENEVENEKYENRISEIEKSISILEQARDKETDAIDGMIDKLEDYKNQWNNITSAYEENQEDLIAAQILGQEWENDILNIRLDVLEQFKNDYIDIQQAMANAAWESANEQIKAAQEASKGSLGSVGNANQISNKINSANTSRKIVQTGVFPSIQSHHNRKVYFDEFSKYHTGLKQGVVEKHSFDDDFKLVQKVGLGDKEVLAILKEGEAVATPQQISNIADGLRSPQQNTAEPAIVEKTIVMSDGTVLRPLQPGDEAYDLMQKFDAYLKSIDGNLEKLVPNSFYEHGRQMDQMANHISNINNISNNHKPSIVIGDINVTCPGVTSQEVMREVGDALGKQIGHLAQMALQEPLRRY